MQERQKANLEILASRVSLPVPWVLQLTAVIKNRADVDDLQSYNDLEAMALLVTL
jgi:hypothetical protein